MNEPPEESKEEILPNGEKSAKKSIPLMAFRPDRDTNKKIEYLSEIYNTKSEAIKKAVNLSYNGLMMRSILERIMPDIKGIFGEKTKLKGVALGKRDDMEDDEIEVDFAYNEGYLTFNIQGIDKNCKNKRINCFLSLFLIEMDIQSLNLIKVTLIKPVISGPFSEIPQDLLKSIHEIAAKHNLQIKTIPISKKSEIAMEYRLEKYIVPREKDWKNKIKKDLQNIKSALEELCKSEHFIDKKPEK